MADGIRCTICETGKLEPYKGRPNEKCDVCGGKARHRIAYHLYKKWLGPLADSGARCLHLAPEFPFYKFLSSTFGGGYILADPRPVKYPHAKVMKLSFPDSYSVFPEEYFDVILHNHVLEHIPGHYKDHLEFMLSLLSPNGYMIFSVPGPFLETETLEGGEFEASDQARLEKFHQEDHLKIFGHDFETHLGNLKNARLFHDGITNDIRANHHVRPNKAPFFILQKV